MDGPSHVGTQGGHVSGAQPAHRRLARTFSGARWGEYRRLLGHALECGYRVVSLEEWLRADEEAGFLTLVLRHDVVLSAAFVRDARAVVRRDGAG